MTRWIAALLMLLICLPSPGWSGGWLCRGDQEVHARPCCEGEDRDGRCCVELSAADEDHDGLPSLAPAPVIAWATGWRAPPLWRVSSRRDDAPRLRRHGPPPRGPPAWLEHRALLI